MLGDEIVNVNGRRLRGLSMPDARAVLGACCNNTDIDVVVARRVSHGGPSRHQPSLTEPLSLLAHHDEHDLINLSSTPLRPGLEAVEAPGGGGGTSTVIRIGESNKAFARQQQQGRMLPTSPADKYSVRNSTF